MSRWYGMEITAYNVPTRLANTVIDAAQSEWDFVDWTEKEDYENDTVDLYCYAEGNLTAGESDEDFAWRTTSYIWLCAKEYVNIDIIATFLEAAPYETHSFDKNDYSKWRKKNVQQSN